MRTRQASALALAGALVAALAARAQAAPTPAQQCESAVEVASGKYVQCRLKAEASNAKYPDAAKRSSALMKCEDQLSSTFATALARYGAGNCPTETSSAFSAYLTQCSDDTVAAAAGGTLPDGDLAMCNADLDACTDDLGTCDSDLATAQGDLGSCQGDLATCEAAPAGGVLKTGQTTCYNTAGTLIACAGTGHDGGLQRGVARSFTDNGDGTITDNVTGLMWEKLSNDLSIHSLNNVYNWNDAINSKVATLNLGEFAGYADWRLPNEFELYSLVSLGATYPSAYSVFFESGGCPANCTVLTCSCMAQSFYWSSSTSRDTPAFAWGVKFNFGQTDYYNKVYFYYVRAVRAGY